MSEQIKITRKNYATAEGFNVVQINSKIVNLCIERGISGDKKIDFEVMSGEIIGNLPYSYELASILSEACESNSKIKITIGTE